MPIRLSWAIIIPKSQGLTLDKAWIDLGITKRFIGLACVAISQYQKIDRFNKRTNDVRMSSGLKTK